MRRVGIHCVTACFSWSLFAALGCGAAPDVDQGEDVRQGEREGLGVVTQAESEPDRRYHCKCLEGGGEWYQNKKPTLADITGSCSTRAGTCSGNGVRFIFAGYSVSNTNSATQNYDVHDIDLNAGDQLHFGGCEAGGSFSGDTYIRLFNGEAEVASDDDHCAPGSEIFYTAPTAGTYSAHLGCFANGSCSGTFPFTVMANSGGIPFIAHGNWSRFNTTVDIPLNAGEQLRMSTCDAGGSGNAAVLSLRNGVAVVANDTDHGNGICSPPATGLVYTAPATGLYQADLGCYASEGCESNIVYSIAPAEQGRISYWWGKVNTHKSLTGSWTGDTDCSSGADLDPLTYCQKFWPATSSVTQVPVTPKSGNIWSTSSCSSAFPSNGESEWTCNGDFANNGATIDWLWCGSEAGTCNATGTKLVRYGADTRWNYRIATDTVGCNNSQFGDPAFGVDKNCYYTDLPSDTWSYCADEYQTCSYSGNVAIAYGTGTTWAYASGTSGSALCDNSSFGDPAVGAMKYCYIKRM